LANEKPAEFFHAIRQVSSPNFGRFSNFQNAILDQLFWRQMNTFHLSIDQFSKLGGYIGRFRKSCCRHLVTAPFLCL
jgi:hypothetical protein